jgi:DnaK suppressor protein
MSGLSRHAHLNRELATVELRLKELDSPTPVVAGDEADQRLARQDGEDQIVDRGRLAERRRLILAALLRIETGDFGRCLACVSPIGAKRLDAMPWAERCLSCQTATELHDERLQRAIRPSTPPPEEETSA